MRFPLFAACLLSACTSLVPSTVMRLNGLSPTTADPAGFAVDLKLPEGIDVEPGRARLVFSVTRSDIGEMRSGTFVLASDGRIYRIAETDLEALRALQAQARQWQAENAGATDGTLSISLSPCVRGDGPRADARVNVDLRLSEDGAFFPLVRNGPTSPVVSDLAISDMPKCV